MEARPWANRTVGMAPVLRLSGPPRTVLSGMFHPERVKLMAWRGCSEFAFLVFLALPFQTYALGTDSCETAGDPSFNSFPPPSPPLPTPLPPSPQGDTCASVASLFSTSVTSLMLLNPALKCTSSIPTGKQVSRNHCNIMRIRCHQLQSKTTQCCFIYLCRIYMLLPFNSSLLRSLSL